MELPHRAIALRAAVLAVAVALVALWVPGAAFAGDLKTPASQTEPPPYYQSSAREVTRIAWRADKVQEERRDGPLRPSAYTNGAGRWQVSFFRDGKEVAQVQVDDRTGAVLEQWTGYQVAWTMARGGEGAFGRALNAPYVWIPFCLLFLVPFVDLRRPFRLLHLDLLVLLAFGASHVFFNRGEIGLSVPLVYPVLLYLLVRMLLAGFRPRRRPGPLVPHLPMAAVAVGLIFLVAFRIGLNVADSNVVDVGYAGVVGADRIVDGDQLYGDGFSGDVERGDTYGPLNYLLYVPFEQTFPWSGAWDDLPAAHAAAVVIDLLVIGGLLLLGRRLRPGREGRALGLALAYAWAAYPYTAFVLESNANDSLVALACIGALLVTAPWARGMMLGLGTAAKFAPLALAPLFARRSPVVVCAALLITVVVLTAPLVPDGGLRELYDRTLGYQLSRPSPFSVWGQAESLSWLHTAVKAAVVALALAVAFRPRAPDARQLAALGAAVLIAVQLAATHWFYLYVVWFVPFVLVALFAAQRTAPAEAPAPAEPERELVPA